MPHFRYHHYPLISSEQLGGSNPQILYQAIKLLATLSNILPQKLSNLRLAVALDPEEGGEDHLFNGKQGC